MAGRRYAGAPWRIWLGVLPVVVCVSWSTIARAQTVPPRPLTQGLVPLEAVEVMTVPSIDSDGCGGRRTVHRGTGTVAVRLAVRDERHTCRRTIRSLGESAGRGRQRDRASGACASLPRARRRSASDSRATPCLPRDACGSTPRTTPKFSVPSPPRTTRVTVSCGRRSCPGAKSWSRSRCRRARQATWGWRSVRSTADSATSSTPAATSNCRATSTSSVRKPTRIVTSSEASPGSSLAAAAFARGRCSTTRRRTGSRTS